MAVVAELWRVALLLCTAVPASIMRVPVASRAVYAVLTLIGCAAAFAIVAVGKPP